MPEHPHVLVATLGGQPQVVTFTLDLLLREGFPIREVIVLHPRAASPSRLYHSLLRLSAEFTGNIYPVAQHPIHFHSRVLELDGTSIDDISDDAHADGTLNTIHRLIGDLKRQGYRIHLSVTGGRRLMALLAISVAVFNFDRHDHIWHIYTPESLQEQASEGALMHAPPGAGVTLIKGPFITLGAYIYNAGQTFRSAQEEQRMQMEAQDRASCAEVASKATPARIKVLQAFARGLRPQQVADELCIALVTVNTHKTALLNLCHNAWNIPDKERLDYHFLAAKFANYFQNDE
ncbi:MAG: histidine kinase [Chloroflexi bacterium]|nr:histidine kinase [Chloroflexota bacterium]